HIFFLCAVHLNLHSFPTRRSSDLFGTTALAFGVTLGFTQLAAFALVLQSSGRPDVAVWHPLRIIDVVNAAMSVEIFPASNFVMTDRKSTRLNSSHVKISYAVFCLK